MSKPKDSFYLFWTAAILLCAVIALFCVVWVSAQKSDRPPDDAALVSEQTQSQTEQTPPEITDIAPNLASAAVLSQTQDAGDAYLNSLVFLGDVTTYNLRYYYALSSDEQIWVSADKVLTLSGASEAAIVYPGTTDTLTAAQAAERRKPAYLVITLGREDTALGKEAFQSLYTQLINSIRTASPDTKIICQSVFPVIEDLAGVTNARLNTANAWIIEVCEQTGCRFLNTREVLTDASGSLMADYSAGDGVQIAALGCSAVVSYVRSHAWQ